MLVAGGLLASAAHAAAEAGLLTIGQAHVFGLTWLIAPGTIRASLITGMLGLQRTPTVIEVSLWLVYAIAISLYVFWPTVARGRKHVHPTSSHRLRWSDEGFATLAHRLRVRINPRAEEQGWGAMTHEMIAKRARMRCTTRRHAQVDMPQPCV